MAKQVIALLFIVCVSLLFAARDIQRQNAKRTCYSHLNAVLWHINFNETVAIYDEYCLTGPLSLDDTLQEFISTSSLLPRGVTLKIIVSNLNDIENLVYHTYTPNVVGGYHHPLWKRLFWSSSSGPIIVIRRLAPSL
jgi:hypothetical protein